MLEMQGTQVRSLDWDDPLEEGMGSHSSILAWRIPRTEEPGGWQSTGSKRTGHSWSDLAHMRAGSQVTYLQTVYTECPNISHPRTSQPSFQQSSLFPSAHLHHRVHGSWLPPTPALSSLCWSIHPLTRHHDQWQGRLGHSQPSLSLYSSLVTHFFHSMLVPPDL